MNPQQLSIRLYGEPVGILQQGQMGEMIFQYFSQSKAAISIGMPIKEAAYEGLPCEAFFGGLLPESETVRKILGKHFHVSPQNSFALLRAIGYDCAGAISCHQIDEPVLTQQSFPLSGKLISDDLLYQYIKALPQKPLFMDLEGLRSSLAGIQDKAAICLLGNRIALPLHGCPTTHILKPSSLHYEGLAVNEYFCMKVAKRIGLPVPEVELRQIKDCYFLLIARYDRRIQKDFITRIHQEDFCQALIRLTSRKYQSEGGPGFKDLFDLLKITSQPAIDRNHLATALVFNYLLGNMDAHGKNFSLLHQAPGIIKLAPFYDLVCTRVYPNLTAKMAMKIGSKYDAEKIFPRHWEQLCNEINYRYLAMEKLIKGLGIKLIDAMDKEKEEIKQKGVYDPIVDKISAFVEANVKQVINRFG